MASVPASALILAAACSTSAASVRSASGTTSTTNPGEPSATVGATTTSEATTTTVAPTPTTIIPVPAGLKKGSKGLDVQHLEQRLFDLRYDVGKVDGVFDTETVQAVVAFQKVEGLKRSGVVDADVAARLLTAQIPAALLPGAEPDRIEIDLKRQVLILWEHGAVRLVTMISSGGNYRYCSDGKSDDGTVSGPPFCSVATTPGGSFKIYRKIEGTHKSALGVLYNPLYFNGGIAIHGEPAVPLTPASHGCVRIPMTLTKWFYAEVPQGMAVYVFGGKVTPVAFSQLGGADPPHDPMPPNVPNPQATTTTTVKPGTTTTTVKPGGTTTTPGATTTIHA